MDILSRAGEVVAAIVSIGSAVVWVWRTLSRRRQLHQEQAAAEERRRQEEAAAAERERIRNMGILEYADHKRRTDPDWPYDWQEVGSVGWPGYR